MRTLHITGSSSPPRITTETFKNESYLAYQGMKVEDSKEIPCELQKTDYYPVSTSQFIYTETDTNTFGYFRLPGTGSRSRSNP